MAGRLVREQVVNLQSGHDLLLDLHTLPAGPYQVTLSTNDQPYLATFQLIHIQP
ncbi:MAG: hypothetical protein IPJ06_12795 [Saprospiraceae bacterium]|nr:hypothetical protein [Saprospiraceae bacterium]